MAASRVATVASAVAAVVLGAGYLAITWDAWLTNFQVRWMCDEDRPFVLLQRSGVSTLAIAEDIVRSDARALTVFGTEYPEVVMAGARGGDPPRYELVQRWPKVLRDYWAFRVVRTDLSVVDRGERNRVLATMGLFRRVDKETEGTLRALRNTLGPPADQCVPSDRVEFVKRVLRPPE
jgi:hypothetical protein